MVLSQLERTGRKQGTRRVRRRMPDVATRRSVTGRKVEMRGKQCLAQPLMWIRGNRFVVRHDPIDFLAVFENDELARFRILLAGKARIELRKTVELLCTIDHAGSEIEDDHRIGKFDGC